MTYADKLASVADKAEHVAFLVGAWQDFGYEVPPAPDCKPIPPLGQRNEEAIKAGHSAVEEIDRLIAELHRVRSQLVTELRQDSDIRNARVDRMLRGEQTAEDRAYEEQQKRALLAEIDAGHGV